MTFSKNNNFIRVFDNHTTRLSVFAIVNLGFGRTSHAECSKEFPYTEDLILSELSTLQYVWKLSSCVYRNIDVSFLFALLYPSAKVSVFVEKVAFWSDAFVILVSRCLLPSLLSGSPHSMHQTMVVWKKMLADVNMRFH